MSEIEPSLGKPGSPHGVAAVPLTLEAVKSDVVQDLRVSTVQVEIAGPAAAKVTKTNLQAAMQAAIQAAIQSAVEDLLEELG